MFNFLRLQYWIACLFLLLRGTYGYSDLQNPSDKKQLSQAISYLNSGQLEDGLKILEQLHRKDPSNPIYLFNIANVYYLSEKYESATLKYGQVIKSDTPLAIPSRLYLARIYLKKKEFFNAYAVIISIRRNKLPKNLAQELREIIITINNEAMNLGGKNFKLRDYGAALKYYELAYSCFPDENLYMTLRDLKQFISQKQESTKVLSNKIDQLTLLSSKNQKTSLFQFLSSELGYNSNLYSLSDNQTISDFVATINYDLNYLFLNSNDYALEPYYDISWNEAKDHQDYRQIDQNFGLKMSYSGLKNFAFSLSPEIQLKLAEKTFVLRKSGVILRMETALSPFFLGMKYYGYSHTPLSEGYADFKGLSHAIELYSYSKFNQISIYPFFLVEKEDQNESLYNDTLLPLSFWSNGGGILFSFAFNDRFEITVDSLYQTKIYSYLALPDEISRIDRSFIGSLKLSYAVIPELIMYNKTIDRINSSTLGAQSLIDNKNYTQLINMTGIQWEI